MNRILGNSVDHRAEGGSAVALRPHASRFYDPIRWLGRRPNETKFVRSAYFEAGNLPALISSP